MLYSTYCGPYSGTEGLRIRMSSSVRRTAFSLVAFFAVCALAGLFINQKVGAQTDDDASSFRTGLKDFSSVYQVVAENYATPLTGKLPSRAIYDGAIPGMLRTLDPHSNFFDPKAFAAMREEQHGRYYGVGMLIQPQLIQGQERISVVHPMAGSPAMKAGIKPGDIIDSIDGVSTKGMTSSDVANRLKGAKGTSVKVTMTRDGFDQPLTFTLVRDEIPNPSLDVAYMIRPGIAYIHITQFQETTGQEFDDAINSFPNLKGLVLDLRGNPGGVLVDAVAVCNRLLKRGQIIVSQRGRAYPEQIYRATQGNGGAHFPIVVLVNHNTASAAEIVSGALQDHDRALIAGETTFGKGLVQTVYPLSDGTGLTLTTYHYFTPSGRLIQRNYKGVSLYDYYYDHDTPESTKGRKVYLTDSGRTVYGGGGITPDVKLTPVKYNDFQTLLLAHYAFTRFVDNYMAHRTVTKDFQVNDDVMSAFENYLKSRQIDFTAANINGVLPWIKASIKDQVFTYQFNSAAGDEVMDDWDPEIQSALDLMPKAEALEETALKADAAKMAANEYPSGPGHAAS
jgi:carboxyl-terminal processing protease